MCKVRVAYFDSGHLFSFHAMGILKFLTYSSTFLNLLDRGGLSYKAYDDTLSFCGRKTKIGFRRQSRKGVREISTSKDKYSCFNLCSNTINIAVVG